MSELWFMGFNGLPWNTFKAEIILIKIITKITVQTSYDIVKAHGGELKVETKEGEGSEFIIQLPIA